MADRHLAARLESTGSMDSHGNELIAEVRASVRPRLYVISGPSGVGKDTIIDNLRPRLPDFYFAVTATTRPRRPGEIDGVHYFFMAQDEFTRHLDDGEFIEHAEVYGNWYGVPKSGIQQPAFTGLLIYAQECHAGQRIVERAARRFPRQPAGEQSLNKAKIAGIPGQFRGIEQSFDADRVAPKPHLPGM